MTGPDDGYNPEDDDLDHRFARYIISPKIVEFIEEQRRSPTTADRRMKELAEAAGERDRAPVIVELRTDFVAGVEGAKEQVMFLMRRCGVNPDHVRPRSRSRYNVFATLTLEELDCLTRRDAENAEPAIARVWLDEPLKALLDRSVRTIKSDACLAAFGADGEHILWAVADSGIDGHHRHFVRHKNLDLPSGIVHKDFTRNDDSQALTDGFGHGTHVAGIIGGQTDMADGDLMKITRIRDQTNSATVTVEPMKAGLRGVAPKCRLLSLKVLDDKGKGQASALISALEHVEELNDFGRNQRIHGVNLSLGYPFDASWYAAGHSPVCTVVNRLSRSGVVVVAAAGNDGSAFLATEGRAGSIRVGVDQSINDPGNAEEAITVGATHGDSPHKYGVSYFSSRGPTADGRPKPDLVAPGERILSCAAFGSKKVEDAVADAPQPLDPAKIYFREESGTSMAAPHVSGAAAALLSIRREFIGRPEAVKAILKNSCTDLHRKADFQGAGLIDLMRAVQSI
jgi:serine protease AprX